MAIVNYNEEKPLIIYTFKKLCNGEQRLAAQHILHWEKKTSKICIKHIELDYT